MVTIAGFDRTALLQWRIRKAFVRSGTVYRYLGTEPDEFRRPSVFENGSGVFTFRAGRLQILVSAGDLPRPPVISLAQTPNGDIWMGSRDVGLFRLSGGKTSLIRNGLPDLKINCLLPDGDQGLWVGTDSGIVRWNGSELSAVDVPPSLDHFQALTMAIDRDANIWGGQTPAGSCGSIPMESAP